MVLDLVDDDRLARQAHRLVEQRDREVGYADVARQAAALRVSQRPQALRQRNGGIGPMQKQEGPSQRRAAASDSPSTDFCRRRWRRHSCRRHRTPDVADQAGPGDRRGSALPALIWADCARVPRPGRHRVHQGRGSGAGHSRPVRGAWRRGCSVALRRRARGTRAADDRNEFVQRAPARPSPRGRPTCSSWTSRTA